MKGGSKIKKVVLQFIGTGIKNEFQAYVKIYDTCGNLLYQKNTYNGELIVNLEENKAYNLVAISYDEKIEVFFYITKNKRKYTFVFARSIYERSAIRTITFLLTDANYNNLPIEKGEIILWQK